MSETDLLHGLVVVGVVLIPFIVWFMKDEYDWDAVERSIERRDQSDVEPNQETK